MLTFSVIDGMDGFEMRISSDDASGRVFARYCPEAYPDDADGWQATPIQVASGEHNPHKLAQLVADHFAAMSGDEPATILEVIERT